MCRFFGQANEMLPNTMTGKHNPKFNVESNVACGLFSWTDVMHLFVVIAHAHTA